MKRWLAAGAVALAAACGEAPSTAGPGPATEGPGAGEPPAPRQQGIRGTVELLLYDSRPGAGVRQPTLEMRSTNAELTSATTGIFHDAEAIIYGEDGSTTHLVAGTGTLDQEAGVARLRDGVVLESAGVRVELERLEWDNEARIALSDAPARIEAGGLVIETQGLRFDPDAGMLYFNEMSARGPLSAAPATEALE